MIAGVGGQVSDRLEQLSLGGCRFVPLIGEGAFPAEGESDH